MSASRRVLVTGRPKATADAQKRRTHAVLDAAEAALADLDEAVDPRTPEAALADLDRVFGPDPAAGRWLTEEDMPLQGFGSIYLEEVPLLFTGTREEYRAEVRASLSRAYAVNEQDEAAWVEVQRGRYLAGMPDYEEFYGPVLRITAPEDDAADESCPCGCGLVAREGWEPAVAELERLRDGLARIGEAARGARNSFRTLRIEP